MQGATLYQRPERVGTGRPPHGHDAEYTVYRTEYKAAGVGRAESHIPGFCPPPTMATRSDLALPARPSLPGRRTVVEAAAGAGFYTTVTAVAVLAAATTVGAGGQALAAILAGDAATAAAWFGLAVGAAAVEAGPFYVGLHDAPALQALAAEVRG